MVNLGGHLSDPSGIFDLREKIIIQRIAVAFSTISLFSTIVTVYWFILLRKNFRRNLIFLLILGDFFKSIWYLTFSSTALALGGIETTSDFCQANGWLLQASIEAGDSAILFMSLHMYLQIFSATSKTFGHDGLYRFRHTVLGVYLSWPIINASLAFINAEHGYISQGPLCTLPIRPFWYRLALTWIPRYLIWIAIMFIALRIYLHVGSGFKVFARQQDRFSSGDAPGSLDTSATRDINVAKRPTAGSVDKHESVAPHAFAPDHEMTSSGEAERRPSHTNWPPAFTIPASFDGPPPAAGNESHRGSRVAFQLDGTVQMDLLQVPLEQKRVRGSISTISSFKSIGDISMEGTRPPTLEPIEEARSDQLEQGLAVNSADTPLNKRRRAIQRQLRLLFIYPAVYMIMYAIPFAYHSMNYSNYYAQHPVYVLGAAAVACQTAMGSVDCLIFGWREKPWKHIPGSDGTFLGSFMFWRFGGAGAKAQWSVPAPGIIPNGQDSVLENRTASSRPRFPRTTSHGSMRPFAPHRKTWSGSSDRNAMDSEMAAQRLALERAERENRPGYHSRSESVNSRVNHSVTEWWDRSLSEAVHDSPRDERADFEFHK